MNRRTLSGFNNLPAFNTAGANFNTFACAIDQRTDVLQIRVEAATGPVIRVGNIVAELRAFAA